MLTRQNRIALHMVDAMPLRSAWVEDKHFHSVCGFAQVSKSRHRPLLPWWMKGALLVLFVAIVVVATARILRAAL